MVSVKDICSCIPVFGDVRTRNTESPGRDGAPINRDLAMGRPSHWSSGGDSDTNAINY